MAGAAEAQAGRRGGAAVSICLSCAAWLTLLRVVQGLLLDLDAATLTVYANGERKGVIVQPGMIPTKAAPTEHGQPVPQLEGPLRWVAHLYQGASVTIDGPLPPPA